MKLSARNQVKGVVEGIQEGACNDIVSLQTKLGLVHATISKAAVKDLGLAVGKEAIAVMKATSVMVGV